MFKNNMVDNMKKSVKDVMDDPKQEMQESGQDWLQYIQEHPIQSIAFGVIGFLAIKGMFK